MSDELLREVLAEVQALRADVGAVVRLLRLKPGVRELLTALLPATVPVFRDKVFTTADVKAWPTLAPIVGDQTEASLSWIFNSAVGIPIAGCRLDRVGTDRAGALWRVHEQVTTPAPASARG